MNREEQLLITLVGGVISGNGNFIRNIKISDTAEFEKMWDLSAKHSLSAIVASGVVENDSASSDIKSFFKSQIYRYVLLSERQDHELAKMCRAFNDEKIPHIPLKGSVVKHKYPQSWQRTSCDIDILIKEKDIDKATSVLCSVLGYTHEYNTLHDISFKSEGGVHIELHYKLVEDNRLNTDILNDVWDYTVRENEDTYTYTMTDDMFYFYHIAHMAKHFKSNGFGIRHLVDTWILNGIDCDKAKRNQLLTKGNLQKFENKMLRVCSVLFGNEASDEETDVLIDYLFNSGTYGTTYNHIARNKMHEKKSTFSYILSRVFMPIDTLAVLYPAVADKKYLYPYYTVKRWIKILLYPNKKAVVSELDSNKSLSKKNMTIFKKVYNDMEL